MEAVHSSQPRTILPTPRRITISNQIILELVLAVVLAFNAILSQTRRFKLAKEFTQAKRYIDIKSAMTVLFTGLISEISAQVEPIYYCPH